MLTRFTNWLKGAGEYSVSVPAMDGALRPNDLLDSAVAVHSAPGVDNLTKAGDAVYFSAAGSLLKFDGPGSQGAECVASFLSDITCLAAINEQVAVGLESGEVRLAGGRFDGLRLAQLRGRPTVSPVAAYFQDPDTLLVALGSQRHPASRWKHDLMERGASGSVWRVHLPSSEATLLADGMSYPYGIAACEGGAILVAECWAHRIVDISNGRTKVVSDDLPFYPARMFSTADKDVLVCGIAPRRQLVEFVLRETSFRKRMMAEVPEPYWMAPSLNSGTDHAEPLQDGQSRRHGVLKSWAPTRSYGLVATMDSSGSFLESFHCRAGGTRHGTSSAVEVGSELFVTAKGGGVLVRMPRHG